MRWMKDNHGNKLMERSLFPEAPDSLIEALNLQEGIPSSMSAFLMHSDGAWILFDAGLGAPHGGEMLDSLKAMGLTPDSISAIFVTHFHGDHIGGMMSEGTALFPKAEVYADSTEYEAWINGMPEEKNGLQRQVMEAYADRLHLFASNSLLPYGVKAIEAKGHTPGHTTFQKGNVIVIGDLMHGAALQTKHPEISGNYDMDKAQAAESRQRILNYAKENNLIMAGMHLPDPGFIE